MYRPVAEATITILLKQMETKAFEEANSETYHIFPKTSVVFSRDIRLDTALVYAHVCLMLFGAQIQTSLVERLFRWIILSVINQDSVDTREYTEQCKN